MNPDMTFEIDHGGEDITRELSRASVPPPRSERRALVRVPALPAGIEMPELRAAAAELDRVRAALAATSSAVSEAQARRNGAQQEDQARAAAAFRSGETAPGPSALAALDVETAGLAARQAAGRLAVAQLEEELAGVLDANRGEYITRTEAAIGDALAEASAALESYIGARDRLLATLTVRNWLAGERKFATGNLGELRGIGQPPPSAEAVLESLRRELTW